MSIKAGWYGWVEYEGYRRQAFVANVGNQGGLTLELMGIPNAQFEAHPEDFVPDPDAMFWTGHCPDDTEDREARAELRTRMIAEVQKEYLG